MTMALIPAAGKSERMGRPKLSLPLGDRTVLQRVIDAFQSAAVTRIMVVVAPHSADLLPVITACGADGVCLPKATPDMRATVMHGLAEMEQRYAPHVDDMWFLSPADHPTLDAPLITQMVQAYQTHAECRLVIPTYQGKRGHPALIAWEHVGGIRQLTDDQGLNVYFRQCRDETYEMPVTSVEILRDLDTPREYEELLARFGGADN